jgi:hypothetical protein
MAALLQFLATMEDRKDRRASEKAQLGLQQSQLELMRRTLEGNVRSSNAGADIAEDERDISKETKKDKIAQSGSKTSSDESGAEVDNVRAADAQALRQNLRIDAREKEIQDDLSLFNSAVNNIRKTAGRGEVSGYADVDDLTTAYNAPNNTPAEKLKRTERLVRASGKVMEGYDQRATAYRALLTSRRNIQISAGQTPTRTVDDQVADLFRTMDPIIGSDDLSVAMGTAVVMNKINRGVPLEGAVDVKKNPTDLFIADVEGNYDKGIVKEFKRQVPSLLANSDQTFLEDSQLVEDLEQSMIASGIDPIEAGRYAARMVDDGSGIGTKNKAVRANLAEFSDFMTTAKFAGEKVGPAELGSLPAFEDIVQEARFRDQIMGSNATHEQKSRAIDDNIIENAAWEALGYGANPVNDTKFRGHLTKYNFPTAPARKIFDVQKPIDKFYGRGVISATDDPAVLGDAKLRELAKGMAAEAHDIRKLIEGLDSPVGESTVNAVDTFDPNAKDDSGISPTIAAPHTFDPNKPVDTTGALQHMAGSSVGGVKTEEIDVLGGGAGDEKQRQEIEDAINNARLEGEVGALMQVLQSQQGAASSAGASSHIDGAPATQVGQGGPTSDGMTSEQVLAMIQAQSLQAQPGIEVQPAGALPPGAGNQGQPGFLPGNLGAMLQAIQAGRQQSGGFSPSVGGFGLQ